MGEISLSVVVPIRNESQFIEQTLQQLVAQDFDSNRVEIIVVDGCSTDNTVELVERFAAANPDRYIRVMSNPRRLSSAARNIGLNAAKGHRVIVIDGHVYLPSTSILRRCEELAIEYDARVLGRPQRLRPPGNSRFQSLVAYVRESKVGHSGESHIYSSDIGWVSPISVAVMYDRQLALEVGGFDEEFDAAEDLEFNYRLEKRGERCLISPEMEVLYYPRDSLIALFRQMRRYGLGRARFIRKHPERFTPETVIPAMFTIGIILLVLGAVLYRPALLLLLSTAGLYALLVLVANRPALRELGGYGLVAVPVAFTVHTGLGFGFLRGWLKSRE